MTTTLKSMESAAQMPARSRFAAHVEHLPVARIRPEDGLGRKRDRAGHLELQRSIERFGVLTPITVRRAPDGSGDYLLIKGQGRTLACRLLGMQTIPAIVVDDAYVDTERVQHFLVENVARLRMRPVDRALLIHRARQDGEETTTIAQRFGVTPSTVRRLLSQLSGATKHEVDALRNGDVSLSMHAVIARHVDPSERPGVLDVVVRTGVRTKDVEMLLIALGWRQLADLGIRQRQQRLLLFTWACTVLQEYPTGSTKERLRRLARRFPTDFSMQGTTLMVMAR